MEPVWLKAYPPQIPHTIDPDKFVSLVDMLEHSCQRFANSPAFTNLGSQLTYRDLDKQSAKFAAYLQNLGLQAGDRVAIMLPNCLQYPIALFGVLRAGLIVVNVNPLYTARELQHQLVDSGAKAILIIENFAHTLAEVISNTAVRHVITTELGDALPLIKRLLVNFVVRYLKKMVPIFHIPGRVRWLTTLAIGEKMS